MDKQSSVASLAVVEMGRSVKAVLILLGVMTLLLLLNNILIYDQIGEPDFMTLAPVLVYGVIIIGIVKKIKYIRPVAVVYFLLALIWFARFFITMFVVEMVTVVFVLFGILALMQAAVIVLMFGKEMKKYLVKVGGLEA